MGRSRGERAPAVEVRRLTDIYPFSTVLGNLEAAQVLGRQPQTLRRWASTQSGPIQAKLVGRRIMWSVDDLQALLDGKEPAH